jgi:hypothetical protein
MKQAAILSMAAFYLLLTTGMFVCIVHCSAETLAAKPPMHMVNFGHPAKKHCKNDKNCDCCKKHGNYVIKENIKPYFEWQFSPGVGAADNLIIHSSILTALEIGSPPWTNINAPPGMTGKDIFLKIHSLRI